MIEGALPDDGAPPLSGGDPGEMPSEEIEVRIEEIADAFLEEVQAGLAPDGSATAARYPELAPWLGRRLKLIGMMRGAGRSTASIARVHCPHCGNPTAIDHLEPQATCSSCGSTFRIEQYSRAASPERQPASIGRFQVLSLLGRGAFGAVYKAFDPELSRTVAVKVPRAGAFASAQDEDRFLREARHAAQLRHPRIVEVHEVGFEGGIPHIVSSFIEGETLAQRMVRDRPGRKEAARIVARTARALDHAHGHRIIHRDVKPQNILLDRAGEPHITDFGLAHREEGEVTVTLDGQILGTPAYMSPEQASGDHETIDSRTDIYSLGVVLYELLTGELPFKGSRSRVIHQVLNEEPRTPRALNDHIPRDLETICLKSMSKQPARRYATADDMARDLEHYLAGEPIESRPVGRLERAWRWCRRNPLAASVAAAIPLLLLCAALVAGYTAFQIARARDEANLRLSKFSIANGFRLVNEGDSLGALSWFSEASRIDRKDPHRVEAHRTRLEAMLMHVPKLTGAWFFGAPVQQGLFSPDGTRLGLVSEGRVWLIDLDSGDRRSLPSPEGEEERRIEFSPDGKLLMVAAETGAVRAWDLASGTAGRLIVRHGSRALRCKFAPDGRRFLTASMDGTCRIWEADGSAGHVLEHGAPLNMAQFFPDGRRVLTLGTDGSIASWDCETGSKSPWIPGHAARAVFAAFSHDGTRVVTTSEDRTAKLWDAQNGKLLGELPGHGNHVVHADFSPDGQRVLTSSLDAYVRVWDVVSRTQVMPPLAHVTGVSTAVYTSGGRRILTACYDGSARFWDAASGRPHAHVLFHPAGIWNAVLSPEGRRVLTCSKDGAAKVWDLAGGERIGFEIPCGGWTGKGGAQVSPDGTRLLVGRQDGAAQVWDIASREAVFPDPVRHRKAIQEVAFSPDGKQFATGSDEGSAGVWDAGSGAPACPPLVHGSGVATVSFSPDARRLATGAKDGSVIIWELAGGARAGPRMAHQGAVRQVRFSPDGRFCATASEDKTARIWDARSGASTTRSLEHTGKVVAAIFSPDGARVATATDDDGAVRVWRAATGDPLTPPFVLSWDLRHIAFSRDGRRLLVATSDRTARIWDAATGEPLTPEMKHQSGVLHAEFSPDGSRIITAGYDRTAIVWDAASGEPLAPPLQHGSAVQYAAFAGNELVVTVPGEGPAQVWSIPASPRPLEDAALIAGMLSGRKVDAVGGLQVLRPEEFRRAWEALRPKYPPLFTAAADEIFAWHQREIRESLAAHLHEAALPHLEVLARAKPEDIELELLRGTTLAEAGRTRDALERFLRVMTLKPDNSRIGFWVTAAQMKLGDIEAARRTATGLRERFALSENAMDANRAIWVSCLHPSFEAGKLVEAATRNADRPSSMLTFRHTLAVVLYRAGRFEESLRELEKCILSSEAYPRFRDWVFLSMIEARRGRTDDARRWLERARTESREYMSQPERVKYPPTWVERFQLELFLREAEATLGAPKETP